MERETGRETQTDRQRERNGHRSGSHVKSVLVDVSLSGRLNQGVLAVRQAAVPLCRSVTERRRLTVDHGTAAAL